MSERRCAICGDTDEVCRVAPYSYDGGSIVLLCEWCIGEERERAGSGWQRHWFTPG